MEKIVNNIEKDLIFIRDVNKKYENNKEILEFTKVMLEENNGKFIEMKD